MEGTGLLKLQRPTASDDNGGSTERKACDRNEGGDDGFPYPLLESEKEALEEEDDSFFDLELPLSCLDDKKNDSEGSDEENKSLRDERSCLDSGENKADSSAIKAGERNTKFAEKPFSASANDHFSKRKIIPVELSGKPQSPIALLKSAPKFWVFTFKKPKEKTDDESVKTEKKDEPELTVEEKRSKNFAVKFRMEEVQSFSMLTRGNSLRKKGGIPRNQSAEDSSKRSDLIQKYLKLIKLKPFYIKVSKKQNEKVKLSGEISMASAASSPVTVPGFSPKREKHGNIQAGIREVCKHLGKSRSASAAFGARSPVSRRDDSLLLQHDGIQSAILHCKRSFNASTGFLYSI